MSDVEGGGLTSSPQSMASRSLCFALFHISRSCCRRRQPIKDRPEQGGGSLRHGPGCPIRAPAAHASWPRASPGACPVRWRRRASQSAAPGRAAGRARNGCQLYAQESHGGRVTVEGRRAGPGTTTPRRGWEYGPRMMTQEQTRAGRRRTRQPALGTRTGSARGGSSVESRKGRARARSRCRSF